MAEVFLISVIGLEKSSMIFEQACFWGFETELLFFEIRETGEELCV